MPRIKYTVEHIFTKLREAEVALSKGQTVVQVSRSLGITEQAPFEGVTAARLTRLAS
jgi:transposase-like protein